MAQAILEAVGALPLPCLQLGRTACGSASAPPSFAPCQCGFPNSVPTRQTPACLAKSPLGDSVPLFLNRADHAGFRVLHLCHLGYARR
jgi:hypothetical protein